MLDESMRAGVLRRLLLLMVLVLALTLAGAAAARAATLRPNTTGDEMTPHDGKCSLREAVEAANSPGKKTDCGTASNFVNYIVLGAKTYQLSIPPATGNTDSNCLSVGKVPDPNASGPLCITSNIALTIVGRGPTTVIAGQPTLKDRLMTVARQASVSLVAENLVGGHAPDGTGGTGVLPCTAGASGADGGAIYNAGSLFMRVITIQGNSAGAGGAGSGALDPNGCAGGRGGAIYNKRTLLMNDSMFIGNVAGAGGAGYTPSSGNGGNGGAGGIGGAIYNASGKVTVGSTTFALNKAGSGGLGGNGGSGGDNGGTGGDGSPGGGIFSTGGSVHVTNATFAGNQAGSGGKGGDGAGSGNGGNGGKGTNGGAIAVIDGASGLVNGTVANNVPGLGGVGGTGGSSGSNGTAGITGVAGGVFVQSSSTANNLTLQNTIAASNFGINCLGSTGSAITDGGHNLSFGDSTCPAVVHGNPKLRALADYGGFTGTLALGRGSAAIDQVPRKGAGCPAHDQRGVKRPQGSACDIGAFEFAVPKIQILTPHNGAQYNRGSRVLADYICSEGGIFDPTITPIKKCTGTVARNKRINTSTLGNKSFTVTAIDKAGNKVTKTVHYTVGRK